MRLRGIKVRKGLLLGVVLLLVVDVVWVGSAGITRHLFHDESYDKPLFWTYFKTTLFSIYLTAFIFWRPWQRMCWDSGVGLWNKQRRLRRVERREMLKRRERLDSREEDMTPATLSTAGNGELYDKPPSPEVEEEEEEEEEEEDSSCAIDETTGQCNPLDPPSQRDEEEEEGEGRGRGKGEEEEEEDVGVRRCPMMGSPNLGEGLESGGQRNNRSARVVDGHVYFHTSSLNGDTCPLYPDLDTCKLVGPPEFQPLNCALSEEDAAKSGPLPSCHTKCCKVRFHRTIEVREARSNSPVGLGPEVHPTGPVPLMPVWKVAILALIFGVVWFFANYLYALALVSKSVALVNTLSSTSSVFVVVLAAIPVLHRAPGDRLTLSRVLVAILSIGGAVMVSVSDSLSTEHKTWSVGALISLASAFLYAIYLVLLKKLVPAPESIELPMFFGFVGLFNAVFLLPLVLIWHYTGLEPFEWPPNSDVWTLLLINGFIGTVLSELLWLMGVFLTSPLVGTLSLALVTPLSIAYSIVVGSSPFTASFFVGALLILLCFIAVSILDHFGAWDPLWALIKKIVIAAKDASVHRGYYTLSEESRSLIGNEPCQCAEQFPSY